MAHSIDFAVPDLSGKLTMVTGASDGIGFVIASWLWFLIGLGVMVVGLIVGFAMRKAGYGVGGSKLKNSGH